MTLGSGILTLLRKQLLIGHHFEQAPLALLVARPIDVCVTRAFADHSNLFLGMPYSCHGGQSPAEIILYIGLELVEDFLVVLL